MKQHTKDSKDTVDEATITEIATQINQIALTVYIQYCEKKLSDLLKDPNILAEQYADIDEDIAHLRKSTENESPIEQTMKHDALVILDVQLANLALSWIANLHRICDQRGTRYQLTLEFCCQLNTEINALERTQADKSALNSISTKLTELAKWHARTWRNNLDEYLIEPSINSTDYLTLADAVQQLKQLKLNPIARDVNHCDMSLPLLRQKWIYTFKNFCRQLSRSEVESLNPQALKILIGDIQCLNVIASNGSNVKESRTTFIESFFQFCQNHQHILSQDEAIFQAYHDFTRHLKHSGFNSEQLQPLHDFFGSLAKSPKTTDAYAANTAEVHPLNTTDATVLTAPATESARPSTKWSGCLPLFQLLSKIKPPADAPTINGLNSASSATQHPKAKP